MKRLFPIICCLAALTCAEEESSLTLPTDAEWAALQGQGIALPDDALTAPTEEEWKALRPAPHPPVATPPAEADFPLPDIDLPPASAQDCEPSFSGDAE